jgi:uncharacterized membrane protein YfcA
LLQIVASTAVMMILFSSSTIALSYAFQHALNLSYATVFAPVCFVASLIGVTVIGRFIKRTGRTSIIIFILAGLITVGTISAGVFGGLNAYKELKHGGQVGFKPFCGQ